MARPATLNRYDPEMTARGPLRSWPRATLGGRPGSSNRPRPTASAQSTGPEAPGRSIRGLVRPTQVPSALVRAAWIAAWIVTVSFAGCGDASPPHESDATATPPPSARRWSPDHDAGRAQRRRSGCDQSALATAANEIEAMQVEWSPDTGTPPWYRVARVAAAAIWNACDDVLDDELRWHVDLGVHHRIPPWLQEGSPAPAVPPLSALDGLMAGHAEFHDRPGIASHGTRRRLLCPDLAAAADRASRLDADSRPAVFYEHCGLADLGLFSKEEYTRHSFSSAIGLSTHVVFDFLLKQNTPRTVARTLVRPLLRDVMPNSAESALTEAIADGLRLPTSVHGDPMVPGVENVVIGPTKVLVGQHDVASVGAPDLPLLLELELQEANDRAARHKMMTGAVGPTHLSLFAHRGASWSNVQAVLRSAREAGFSKPVHLVVLGDDAAQPLRDRRLDTTAAARPRSLEPKITVAEAIERLGG